MFGKIDISRYGEITAMMNKDKPKPRLNTKQKDVSEITLSPEQAELFKIMEETRDNMFITGKAGTGKSLLLQYFRQKSNKNVVVVAPTGVAALNVRGQTIHSLFKIPPAFIPKNSLKLDSRTAALLKHVDTVVIDEISMVRADLMDAIDHLLKQARENKLPFGGVQMIMFGDLYQLPPIISDPELHRYFIETYGGYYFFNADAWNNTDLYAYELSKIYRQSDQEFINILNSIRRGEIEDGHLAILNEKAGTLTPTEGVITLATTNRTVNEINSTRLSRLLDKAHEYKAVVSGDIDASSFPTDEFLQLKKGAQVMFIKNDKDKRWVNGTIGVVESLSPDEIKVNVDGISYVVNPDTWNKIRYYYDRETQTVDEEIVSSFTQYPLRLAWAITVHKSQGQTYETVAVDMGNGAFTYGQTYVALSRCRSLEGLFLKREIVPADIMVDQSIVEFMNKATLVKL
jgi:ATP-dependent DNA helicase PIF1